jgi:diaminopimelate epimerase
LKVADIPFAKGQALGNDYLVLDAADLPGPLTPSLIRAFCDRHHGAGSDGVLLGHVGRDPIALRIFNPDGTEAEKSGNGLRIFGAWLHGRGLVADQAFTVRLPRDDVRMVVEGPEPGGALRITVAMGPPSFTPGDVGFDTARAARVAGGTPGGAANGPGSERSAGSSAPGQGTAEPDAATAGYVLDLGDAGRAEVHPVSLGNPHCVVLVERLEREDFLRRAPLICVHPAFPAGTNVQFARVAGPALLDLWIWERGAGETLASGSSSCAAVAVARELGRVQGDAFTVRMQGGEVGVTVDTAGGLHLRGPAQVVYRGVVPRSVWEGWAASPRSAPPTS